MKKRQLALALLAGALAAPTAMAQVNQNPDKFLGNITTSGQVNYGNLEYYTLWDQMTPENESKWSSCEGSRGNFSWWGCDNCYNYCRDHGLEFKFHCLIWGAQYPGWMDNLDEQTQYSEIVKWMDAVKNRYPDLDLIDVVNEALPGHQPAPYREALGGDGVTGYDWIVKAFEMAHDRWPDAILIYNDFNTFQWNTDQFINLVKVVRDAGAPIDAYGCQSHDLTDISFSSFQNAMTKIQNALKMPMYSSEYDIDLADDNRQLKQYSDQIKYMWERDYVAGITLWGYILGRTWVGNSGIINQDGTDRAAMRWLREYMASDEAKTTKSPFPGRKKEASVYIRPDKPYGELDVPFNINVDATLRTKTIDHIDLYVNSQLRATMTEAPYQFEYTPSSRNHVDVRAVVYDTEGNKYERRGGFNVVNERKPFLGEAFQIPGKIQAEDFDICGDGISYHDSNKTNSGTNAYRTDSEGVDIISGATGYAIGHVEAGEWLEYTVHINESGSYDYIVNASSANADGGQIKMYLYPSNGSTRKDIATIDIPNNGNWNRYTEYTGQCTGRINKGDYRLRVYFPSGSCNLDYIVLHRRGAGIEDVEAVTAGVYDVYTTTGIYMGEVELEGENAFATKLRELTSQSGVYLIRNKTTGASQMVKI